MFVLIAKEKHGKRYFVAADKNDLGEIALKLLRERDAEGYWYSSKESIAKQLDNDLTRTRAQESAGVFLDLSEEELAALPEPVRSAATETRAKHANSEAKLKAYYADDFAFAEKLEKLFDASNPDLDLAYQLLNARREAEYEGFTVETSEEF